MDIPYIILIYFLYGLAFFSMGLLVAIEGGRASDPRLRMALRPLAGFGLVHALHEWLEMFDHIREALGQAKPVYITPIELIILAFSFLSLAAFGSYLLTTGEASRRIMLLVPLGLEAIWVFGLLILRGRYPQDEILVIADVWTRYTLAIPSALLAAVGLVIQQRVFRRSGLIRFGQDSLWAAVAFGWYGLVGQIFTRASSLPPSTVVNQELFLDIFGFPVQLLRALMAIAAAVFVIRFLRAFQVETERKIADLQSVRLKEAQEREALRGELYKRVVSAQEAERTRVARELHDETGQALTAIGMGLRGLSARLNTSDTERAERTLKDLEDLVAHSLLELQRLVADLRPSHLDDLGLPAAIRWYMGDVQARTGLKVKVMISGKESAVSSVVKTALFRVAQEAITNVIKHAEARKVIVEMKYEDEGVRIGIRDDGRGFNVNEVNDLSGHPPWGLAGMRERTMLLGGAFSLQSRPGAGTSVEVFIPYHEEEVFDNDHPPVAG